jgi:hypothetical protein
MKSSKKKMYSPNALAGLRALTFLGCKLCHSFFSCLRFEQGTVPAKPGNMFEAVLKSKSFARLVTIIEKGVKSKDDYSGQLAQVSAHKMASNAAWNSSRLV